MSNRTDPPRDPERTAGRGHRHWPKLLLSALVGLTVTAGVVFALLD